MTQSRINKLYEGLSNKEKAALAFCYSTDRNELELKRIEGTVRVKHYACRDLEYEHWLDGFFNLAALWAIECVFHANWTVSPRQSGQSARSDAGVVFYS